MPATRLERVLGPGGKRATLVSSHKAWIVPRIWPESTVAILGGGPSLPSAEDLKKIPLSWKTIAVNMAFRSAPFSDVLFYGDPHFPSITRATDGPTIDDFAGLVVTRVAPGDGSAMFVAWESGIDGISKDPTRLRWNRSSGACAIGLARHFGAKRIVLFGFDMRIVDGRKNFHSWYGRDLKNPFEQMLEPFGAIERDLHEEQIECINATPGSAIRSLPIVDPVSLFV